jgi:hypothetical protein
MESVIINGKEYKYVAPTSYENTKLLKKRIKNIKEKIKASQFTCYKDKVTKKGTPYYSNYPELLIFLEGLLI